MRRRLHVVRHWRQPRVHVRCRVCCDCNELLSLRRRLLLDYRRIVDVLAVRGGLFLRLAWLDDVHGMRSWPVDRVRRLVLVRGVCGWLLPGRFNLQGLPCQLGRACWKHSKQLRLQP